VWLATESSLAATTGQYFANCRPAAALFSADTQGIAELDAICARF